MEATDNGTGAFSGAGDDLLDDSVSIIRLLRVFLGATVGDDEEPPSISVSGGRAAAREQAGCALWDMSADEGHASTMCGVGLAAVSCKVLGDCADAKARAAAHTLATGVEHTGKPATDTGGVESPEPKEADAAGSVAGATDPTKATGELLVPPDGGCVERLREVACGLLANVCSHRGLRLQIVGSPSLGEELLRAFHDSDDPASLAELLRLFSAVALMKNPAANSTGSAAVAVTATGNGAERSAGQEETTAPAGAAGAAEAAPQSAVAHAVDFARGLAERETLERLVFFLENSLEERLLAWACSLTYSLMYRHGDVVIGPLVDVYRLEESLATLLNSRSTDLAYEKLGGTETGLDVLLRCLEVLSTSEVSSLGPAPPAALAAPTGAAGPPADATAGAVSRAGAETAEGAGGTSQVRDSEGQRTKRRKVEEREGAEQRGEEGSVKASHNGEAASTAAAGAAGPACRRKERRGRVIRGLVATLVPWEHSRRIQRAALLVLGNVLGNVLEDDPATDPRGFSGGEGGDGEARCSSESCARELDKSLVTWDAGGEGEWGGGGKEKDGKEAVGAERLANARHKFQEAVDKLVGDDDEDRLGEELQEAADNIKAVFDTAS
eukprot:g15965.t1